MTNILDLAPTIEPTAFHIDFKSMTVDQQGDGDLVLSGYANTWAEDRDSEAFLRSAFESAIDKYMLNPIICYEHDRKSVLGRLLDRPVLNDIGVQVKALITKPPPGAPPWRVQAFDDIKRGVLRAMSVGGIFYRNAKDFPAKIIGLDWFETSVVSVPANPFSVGQVAGAKGLTLPTDDENIEPISLASLIESILEDKAAATGIGRGHGRHRSGGRHRRSRRTRRIRSTLRHRAQRVHKVRKASRAHAPAPAPIGNASLSNVSSVGSGVASGVSSGKAADDTDDTDDTDDDDGELTIDDLLDALSEALEDLQGNDDLSDQDKADAVANLLEDFSDEADDILGDSGTDDNEAEGKTLRLVDLIDRVRTLGGVEQAETINNLTKESKMADDKKNEPTGGGEQGGGTTATVDQKALNDLSTEVERLRAKEREREMEIEAETKAAQLLEEESKALEQRQQRERDEEAELDRRVQAAMDRQRQSSSTGRKFVHVTGQAESKSASSTRNFVDFLRDVREARNGDFEAFGRLREESKGAAASYGIKAMGEGTTTTGGFLVPPQYWQQGLAEFRIAAAKLRPLCTVIQGINSNLVYIPRETGISTVGWTAENATKPSTDQTFGQISVPIFTLAGISKVSNQLLEDSSPAVDQIVRLDLGRAIGREEDIRYINGDGNNRPVGILQTAGVLTVAYVAGATGLADAVSACITAVQTNYFGDPDAVLAHPRNVGIMRTAKDTSGRYIFTPGWSPELSAHAGGPASFLGADTAGQNASPVGSVWGLPVISDANVPTTYLGTAPTGGTESPVIVGKFDEAWILERTGVNVDVSDEAGTSFESNQTWYRAEERQGFTAARQPAAFCYITGLTPTIAG